MIEELKMILDSIGDLSGIALWVVGAFIAYRLIIMLAVTGSAVFIARLLIEKLHDAFVRNSPTIEEITQRRIELKRRDVITGVDFSIINSLLRDYRSKSYFHQGDIDRLQSALENGLAKRK
jgi:hypothetical protein